MSLAGLVAQLQVALDHEAERFRLALQKGDPSAVSEQRYKDLTARAIEYFRGNPGLVSRPQVVKAIRGERDRVAAVLDDLKRHGYIATVRAPGRGPLYYKTKKPCWLC